MAEITTFSTTIGGPHTLKTFSYRLRNPTADTLILEGVRPGTELGIYYNPTGDTTLVVFPV
jgi:hypothetical protein